jgi:hypothetical protein
MAIPTPNRNIRNSTMSLTTLVICFFISQICFWDHKYVFHLGKVFIHLVQVILNLVALPHVQIYQIIVRLLMSHEKCPIWQVLFIIKFVTFAFFFQIVPYFLQVHNVLLQMSEMSLTFFPFLSNTFCINRLKKSLFSSFSFFSYCTNSLVMGLTICPQNLIV